VNILIKNADIITCNASDDVLQGAFLGIKDGYIDFIDTKEDALKDFKADRIIDAKGNWLCGFGECPHPQRDDNTQELCKRLALEDWLFGNVLPVEEKLTPEDIYWVHCWE